ncbi:MAG TPA: TonB family protein [Candidatus Bathyarchaeia archaeon]|nr:TonB family protein [Candidatus Bathyarchaeia archaeon]
MRSSFLISLVAHTLLVVALAFQWRSGTSVHAPEYVYSVRVIGPIGGGGSPGEGSRRGGVRLTTPNERTKAKEPRTEESKVAVPKEAKDKAAAKPDSDLAQKTYDLGEPQGVLPIGGGGGGGGGSGGGWGTGSGSGRGPGSGSASAMVEPKPLFIPWPKYPAHVKQIPYGTVELLLLINAQGDVEDVKVTRGLSLEELNTIAVQTARKIRFSPGLANGVRAPMWVRLTIGFQPR